MEGESQIVRQWCLLRKIAAGCNATTIKRLVADTGVSDKTIRRDIAELRQAGFPIVERVGEYGRKTFALESADLPALSFTYDEALALYLCRRTAAMLAGTFIADSAQQAFRKIRATLPKSTFEYVERVLSRVVHTSGGANYTAQSEILDQVMIGIEDCKAVFVTYHSERSTEPVTYDVYPLGLADHHGTLYIIGISPDHDEIRTWKLDRMQAAEVTRLPFQRPDDFDLSRYLAGSFGVYHGRDDIHVRVRFNPTAARYVSERQRHASQQVTRERDGSVLVQWQVSSLVEVKSYILSFGSAAEVLEPAELIEEIRAEAARLGAIYATNSPVENRSTRQNNAFRHQRK